MYQYQAKISECITGDTINAEIDLGFLKKITLRLRLYGIVSNGDRSKDKLSDYVLGKDVMIQTMKNKSGKRSEPLYLCVIYLPDDMNSVNDRMVNSGYANRLLE